MSDPEILWPAPDALPALKKKDVHLWALALDQDQARREASQEILNPDELARASRFRFECDRHRFIVGRGLLRAALGHYTQTAPGLLNFSYGPQGKPALAGVVEFNLAHSGGLAILAVSRECMVGVDVEEVRTTRDIQGIAERFFSPSEVAALNATPIAKQPEFFFRLWTCKEAWLKATGEGIAKALDQIEVSLPPNAPAKFLSLHGGQAGENGWTLRELNPAKGYLAALAAPAVGLTISCWRWPN